MMEIKIYQINLDRDKDAVAFESLSQLEEYKRTSGVNAALYDRVFEGSVEAKDLEDVYRIFNIDKPESYGGRSLSVSDVVEVVKSDEVKSGFFYCDTIGFQTVLFDSAQAHELSKQTITVALMEPGKLARIAEIDSSLEGLQKVVGGYIEEYFPFENDDVCIVCNEEGKFNGMSPCRAIYGEDQKLMDIVFGPFIICDATGENFGSLNQEQLEKYTQQFRNPERFFRVNGEISAVPYEPRPVGLER